MFDKYWIQPLLIAIGMVVIGFLVIWAIVSTRSEIYRQDIGERIQIHRLDGATCYILTNPSGIPVDMECVPR